MIWLALLACAPKGEGTVDTADTSAAPVGTSSWTGSGTGSTATGGTPTGASIPTSTTTGAPSGPARADEVVHAPGADSGPFRDAVLAINGVRGGGASSGSLDVYGVGLSPGDDVLVLGWSDRRVIDSEGVDLVVFENPFDTGPTSRFMDPAVVEVSPDGEDYVAFPTAYLADDPGAWSADPRHWVGFAGVTPTLRHAEDNPVDPLGPDAGGDGFDLADLPEDNPVTARVWAEGVVAVRITSASVHVDPNTGATYPRDPVSNGPDIDGVWARALVPR
ncbi:MAG: hypothetical protein ACI8PZ_001718 [Myxococcota bacterium]|jgi:hypothetical protein